MKLFSRNELTKDLNSNLEIIHEKEVAAAKRVRDQLAELNKAEAGYNARIMEKKQELGEAELKLRILLANQQKEITLLEERRNQALAPIIEEQAQLEKTRDEVNALLLSIDEKNAELKKSEATIRAKERDVLKEQQILEATKVAVTEENERQQAALKVSMDEAREIIKQLDLSRVSNTAALQLLDERQNSLERAEHTVRASMLLADQKIATEREEQRKTEKKKKELAKIVSDLKHKGVWQTR